MRIVLFPVIAGLAAAPNRPRQLAFAESGRPQIIPVGRSFIGPLSFAT